MPKFDNFDRKILDKLQTNARITNVELADSIGLSPAPCLRRVKELESDRVIEGYVAILNRRQIGLRCHAYIAVELESAAMSSLSVFENEIKRFPEIVEAHVLTGHWDYMLHVIVPDLDDFERFLRNHLSQISGVSRLHSSIALREVVRTTKLPLDYLGQQKD